MAKVISHSRAIACASALARGLAKTNVATEYTVPLPLFFVTKQGTPRSRLQQMREDDKDDGSLQKSFHRQPRYPAHLRSRTGGFASPSFDGYALAEAPRARGGFLSNVAELNVRIMFLQLSVEADMRRDFSASV